jgi:hypothetical protein
MAGVLHTIANAIGDAIKGLTNWAGLAQFVDSSPAVVAIAVIGGLIAWIAGGILDVLRMRIRYKYHRDIELAKLGIQRRPWWRFW